MKTIGFIGLGTMGKPMARNLMKAGFTIVVLTRTRAKADELLREGATWADTPRAVAAQCDAIITMLPDSPQVEQVIAGKDGIFDGARRGAIVIDMSTSSPVLARQLARDAESRGIDFLDAPVSGGDVGAANATLSIMVGGSATAFQRALPLLQTLGKNIVHIGGAGAGQITKAANQIVVGLTIEAISEALVLATKSGGSGEGASGIARRIRAEPRFGFARSTYPRTQFQARRACDDAPQRFGHRPRAGQRVPCSVASDCSGPRDDERDDRGGAG